MKFRCENEMNAFSFDDAGIVELKIDETNMEMKLEGAIVKDNNSQNSRFEDCFCGTIVLQLQNAEIVRIVKEGLKYYNANGELTKEIPDEDIPLSEMNSILRKCTKGKVFTMVIDEVEEGYAYEFGIDVPKGEDDEEVDTFWLCVKCIRTVAGWDRFCGPVNG